MRFSLPSIKCSEGPLSLRLLPNPVRCLNCSLRSKRFREAKSEEKAKNGGFGVLPARKWGESKNKKEGVGEGKEGNACRQTP